MTAHKCAHIMLPETPAKSAAANAELKVRVVSLAPLLPLL